MSSISLMEQNNGDERLFERSMYDKMEMIFLYPDVEYGNNKRDIMSILSIIFSVNIDTQEKADMLKSRYDIKVDNKEMEAMFGFLDKNEDIVEAEFKKAKMEAKKAGRAEGIAEGRVEGLKEGRAEGKAEGLEEGLSKGEQNAKVKCVRSLMSSLNIDAVKAMDMLGFTEEEKKLIGSSL